MAPSRVLCVSALLLGALQGSAALAIFPAAGFSEAAYDKLQVVISQKLSLGEELCVAHGPDGAQAALRAGEGGRLCARGLVLLGAAPSAEQLAKVSELPVLVLAGELDGVVRFSHFAVARHGSSKKNNNSNNNNNNNNSNNNNNDNNNNNNKSKKTHRFAALRGASHMSFASGAAPAAVAITDLKATLAEHEAHSAVAELIQDFLGTSDGSALSAAELLASALADPLVDALKLEGSTQLAPSCNSDFPTNPTCNYPKFPDHSVPFGPAPAPNPPIASDCICGSPWVADTAARMMADLPAPAKMFAKDAFHDVADVHPFHLPHIFNDCPEGPDAKCVLNSTSLTMPVVKAGDLWPSALASRPLSAFELRSKLKSKEAYWSKAGVAGAGGSLDQNMSLCADINRAALQWAVEHAETGVAKRFAAKGEPLVIVDDQKATIGATGPEWIKDELVFSRVADSTSPTGTRVEVQSWMFVVGNANDGNVPWFLPAGMHYCKLLSPARALEWIYTDAFRGTQEETFIV